nr:RNA polymerase sigma factor [uncultured Brevundimonas sp.]
MLKTWFCDQVLPHEPALTAYLLKTCKDADTAFDMRHDVYEAALVAARSGVPTHTRAFLFTVARNLVIDRARRQRIVAIDLVADLNALEPDRVDFGATERQLDAREALRLAQAGFERLPARCREVVRLRKVEGLSTREAAERMGVSIDTIERQLVLGVRAMADAMLGGRGRIERRPTSQRKGARR